MSWELTLLIFFLALWPPLNFLCEFFCFLLSEMPLFLRCMTKPSSHPVHSPSVILSTLMDQVIILKLSNHLSLANLFSWVSYLSICLLDISSWAFHQQIKLKTCVFQTYSTHPHFSSMMNITSHPPKCPSQKSGLSLQPSPIPSTAKYGRILPKPPLKHLSVFPHPHF